MIVNTLWIVNVLDVMMKSLKYQMLFKKLIFIKDKYKLIHP